MLLRTGDHEHDDHTPPRDPNQVPDPLKDDVGKHNETEFNEGPDDEVVLEDEDDDDQEYRDGDDE